MFSSVTAGASTHHPVPHKSKDRASDRPCTRNDTPVRRPCSGISLLFFYLPLYHHRAFVLVPFTVPCSASLNILLTSFTWSAMRELSYRMRRNAGRSERLTMFRPSHGYLFFLCPHFLFSDQTRRLVVRLNILFEVFLI